MDIQTITLQTRFREVLNANFAALASQMTHEDQALHQELDEAIGKRPVLIYGTYTGTKEDALGWETISLGQTPVAVVAAKSDLAAGLYTSNNICEIAATGADSQCIKIVEDGIAVQGRLNQNGESYRYLCWI